MHFFKNRLYQLAAFFVGASSAIVQLVMLRECLGIFNGNELISGVILCNWMLLTGAGALLWQLLRKKTPGGRILAIFISLLSVLPLLSIYLNSVLRPVFFEAGTVFSFTQIFLWSALLLMPFCLLSGALFSMLTRAAKAVMTVANGSSIYAWESLGSFGGGLFTGIFLLGFLNNLQVLNAVTLVLFVAAILILVGTRKFRWLVFPILIGLSALAVTFYFDHSHFLRRAAYPQQQILESCDSPFGNLVVTATGDQRNFFSNASLLFTSWQQELDEESVHLALMQRRDMKKVLIVGGHASGILKQLAKYPVMQVDFCEEDPQLIRLQKKFDNLQETPYFKIRNTDCRLLLKSAEERYDAILINTGEPGSLLNNRCYTREFFALARSHLSDSGIFMLSLNSSAQYMGSETRELQSSIFRTLGEEFQERALIPGQRNWFLASDGPIITDMEALSAEWMLPNVYVSPDYLNDYSTYLATKQIIQGMEAKAPVNSDLRPVSSYLAVQSWLEVAGGYYKAILVIAGLILLIPLFLRKGRGAVLWSAGFSGTSIEMMLLLAYQTAYGHLYSITGVFFAVFMVGLALGAFSLRQLKPASNKSLSFSSFGLALWSSALAGLILISAGSPSILQHVLFFLMNFVTAFLCGRQYALATRLPLNEAGNFAGRAYAYDLMGAAAGALFVSALLLPLLGTTWLSLGLGAWNLLIGLVVLLRPLRIKSAA